MTWDELKKHVDMRLAALGADGSVYVDWIDLSCPEENQIGVESQGMSGVRVVVESNVMTILH